MYQVKHLCLDRKRASSSKMNFVSFSDDRSPGVVEESESINIPSRWLSPTNSMRQRSVSLSLNAFGSPKGRIKKFSVSDAIWLAEYDDAWSLSASLNSY